MATRRLTVSLLLLFTFGCAQKPIQSAVADESKSTTMINPLKETAPEEKLDTKALAKKAFAGKTQRKPATPAVQTKPVQKAVESAPVKAQEVKPNAEKEVQGKLEEPKAEIEANPVVGNFFLDHWLMLLGFAVIFAVSVGIYRVAKPRA